MPAILPEGPEGPGLCIVCLVPVLNLSQISTKSGSAYLRELRQPRIFCSLRVERSYTLVPSHGALHNVQQPRVLGFTPGVQPSSDSVGDPLSRIAAAESPTSCRLPRPALAPASTAAVGHLCGYRPNHHQHKAGWRFLLPKPFWQRVRVSGRRAPGTRPCLGCLGCLPAGLLSLSCPHPSALPLPHPCSFAYVTSGISLFFSLLLALGTAATLRAARMAPHTTFLPAVCGSLAAFATFWWLVTAVTLTQRGRQASAAGLPAGSARNGVIALSWLEFVLFLAATAAVGYDR